MNSKTPIAPIVERPRDPKILPKWAQERIADLEREIERLKVAADVAAIATERGRNWFTLPGPQFSEGETVRRLWLLDRNSPYCVCNLYRGDVLFVGRAR